MLEKNSHIVLTPEDLRLYNQGIVSDRVKQTWGIDSISELEKLIYTSNELDNSQELE